MTMSNEKPIAVAMIICDQVITAEGSRKKSLIGCFNNVSSSIFPTKPITCYVFVALTNGQGMHKAELRCINEDENGSKVFGMAGPLAFIDPLQTVEIGFRLVNLTFPKPGKHVIEFWCDGELLLERSFSVQQIIAGKA
jgi:hypothetical protein